MRVEKSIKELMWGRNYYYMIDKEMDAHNDSF